MIKLKGNTLYDSISGEVYSSDISPKFQNLNYDDYVNAGVRYLDPMKATELSGDDLNELLISSNVMAEQKWDGHRALIHITEEANRVFSRNVSKQTGWFSENSDQVPHIRDLVKPSFSGTVLDGELTLPIKNCTCRDVQSVTGALPETALKNQLERGFAEFNAYDILFYKNINIQSMPYWKRKIYLWKAINEFNVPFIKMCLMYALPSVRDEISELWENYDQIAYNGMRDSLIEVPGYTSLYNDMIANGDEGIILKDITKRYERKRSKNFVKMKAHNTYDCVILGYEEPTAEVDLSERKTKKEDWPYWETYEKDIILTGLPDFWNEDECCPVSKFYAMNWIGAIKIGVFRTFDKNSLSKEDEAIIEEATKLGDFAVIEDDYTIQALVPVGRCSGLDEKTRADISDNREDYLGAVVEVEAQKIINSETGSLQHPRFTCFRIDKNAEDCTMEDHLRKYGEGK